MERSACRLKPKQPSDVPRDILRELMETPDVPQTLLEDLLETNNRYHHKRVAHIQKEARAAYEAVRADTQKKANEYYRENRDVDPKEIEDSATEYLKRKREELRSQARQIIDVEEELRREREKRIIAYCAEQGGHHAPLSPDPPSAEAPFPR